jgi:hypothetical protein
MYAINENFKLPLEIDQRVWLVNIEKTSICSGLFKGFYASNLDDIKDDTEVVIFDDMENCYYKNVVINQLFTDFINAYDFIRPPKPELAPFTPFKPIQLFTDN